jgi:antitoxin HicB
VLELKYDSYYLLGYDFSLAILPDFILLTLIDMRQLTYRVLLTREPEGGYTVNVPALPGCITYGETVDEAISMAREAIELYVDSLVANNEPVPDESNTLEYSLTLQSTE